MGTCCIIICSDYFVEEVRARSRVSQLTQDCQDWAELGGFMIPWEPVATYRAVFLSSFLIFNAKLNRHAFLL